MGGRRADPICMNLPRFTVPARTGWLALTCLLLVALAAGEPAPDPRGSPPIPPKSLKRPPPIYPYDAAMAGLNGKVLVAFVIDTQGQVVNPHVIRSNNPWFERPALDAILKWKFEPARKDGRPVNTRASQLLEFSSNSARGGRDLWRVPSRNPDRNAREELRWTQPPEPTGTAFPVYPWDDFQARRSGRTELNFLVGPTGRVVAAKVVSATTPAMAQAALAMIDTWEFKPARRADGTACYAALRIRHDFRHGGGGDVPITDGAHRILRRIEKSPEKIVPASALDEKPRPLSTRAPVYPSAFLAAGRAGSAVIEFVVDEEGDAQLPRIVSCSETEFGYAAVQAVATWRFAPPRKGGKPVATRVQAPVEFVAPAPMTVPSL